uniref:Dynein light chain n=1 Tax=Trichuris muris TaxID=70415 RepID=A0A5S6R3H2_TRIMR
MSKSQVINYKPTVEMSEMDDEGQNLAIDLAIEALNKQMTERNVAAEIKRGFDNFYGGKWQCIVGREFSCHCDHEPNCFIYYFIGKYAILLWR